MKVEVLQAKDITFRKLRYWSDWVDIAVFNFAGYGHLLQMKVSRRNSKKFRSVPYKNFFQAEHASVNEAGNLMPINNKLLTTQNNISDRT